MSVCMVFMVSRPARESFGFCGNVPALCRVVDFVHFPAKREPRDAEMTRGGGDVPVVDSEGFGDESAIKRRFCGFVGVAVVIIENSAGGLREVGVIARFGNGIV